jgi:hypothetical protein
MLAAGAGLYVGKRDEDRQVGRYAIAVGSCGEEPPADRDQGEEGQAAGGLNELTSG